MIPTSSKQMQFQLLKSAVESLSIPPGVYEKAVARYEAVTSFLDVPGSRVASWKPVQYVQGSAAIGLAIRPLGRDDFDFDVACELTPPPHLTSSQVRREVELRLREDANYARMLNTEKMRCLRLDYAETEKFHLDIVVAKVARWLSPTGTAVQVPDKALEQWVGSDPSGYIAWFKARQSVIRRADFTAWNSLMTVCNEAAPAPSQPKSHEKVPVQWMIQIMKRHRDLRFDGPHWKNMPISAIITTLAAKAYRGEEDVLEALPGVTARMLDHFDDHARTVVANPALSSENFADKWERHPQRRAAFFEWHAQFSRDLAEFLHSEKIAAIGTALEKLVGGSAKTAAFKGQAQLLNGMQGTGTLGTTSRIAALASTSLGARGMPAHTNFGRHLL